MVIDWRSRALEKRREQAESIPPEWRLRHRPAKNCSALDFISSCGLLTAEELRLTAITDGWELQAMLLSAKVSCEEVVTAFAKRAAIAQQIIGCCTEMFFDTALLKAKELDTYFRTTGKPIGPLHGFPISFKDSFDVEGIDTTIGWVGKIGKPATLNSTGVELMLSLGAIIYVKTNVPQSLMMSDSYNHVFLQSLNALNSQFISGGSSGGEGALVGAHGSLLGIGTDIGGSIRIPAILQGLYGLSPTQGRVPNDPSSRTQKYVVPPVAGPIASSLSSIELYMSTLLSSELKPWNQDPYILPIPWRKELAICSVRPLKIAFIYDDGIVRPQPPIKRVALQLASRLKGAGHQIIEWDTTLDDGTSHIEGYNIWLKAVLADGGQECRDLCRLVNEPLIEGMLVGSPKDLLSLRERRELEEKKIIYSRAYLKRWTLSGIDALIMPVAPWVSFRPRVWVQSKQMVTYTSIWNLLNYAALAIPVSSANINLDRPEADWKTHIPRNEADDFNHKQYDIHSIAGMPVGLQIVGGRFGEEKAVSIAKMIQTLP